ncbi:hypothetical protein B4109_0400 [Geobacillus stearothermophilus]|uniref:BH0509 family protein n=3 Tax=Geobacillus stearothermophilus TaxID=1422 RepID=A0A150ML97_GEOSE|nr:hypothetical protein B4109_0400 [Geobacillus stearothermophilus]
MKMTAEGACIFTEKGVAMMSRAERKNMIEFIEKVRGLSREELACITDAEIEYIYERYYYHHEEIVE